MLIGRLLGAYQLFVVSLLGVNREFVWSLSGVCQEFYPGAYRQFLFRLQGLCLEIACISSFEFSRSFQVPIGNLTFVCWILKPSPSSH